MPSTRDPNDWENQPAFSTGTNWPGGSVTMQSNPSGQPAGLSKSTSARLPTVIPAGTRRRRNVASRQSPARRRRQHMAWPIVLFVGCLVIVFTLVFAVPLGTSQQQPITLAQGISNLIVTGEFGAVNVAEKGGQPSRSTQEPCGGTDLWGTCAKVLLDNGTLGTGNFQAPITGDVISQPFGVPEYQTWCGCVKPHSGIDLAAPYGTDITAADNGEVIWVGWDWSGLGWAVKISHGNYMATVYGHMADYTVQVGQYVTRGQVVGHEGSTGASTGPHLHFMVLSQNVWVNPQDYMSLP